MGTIDGERTEAGLRVGEDWLRRALVAAQTASWEWDIRTDRLTWSEGAHAILGLPEGLVDATNEGHLASIHPDDRARTRRQEQQAVASGADYENEYRLMTPAGTVRWLVARGRVVEHDATGGAVRMLGVTVDVTARKHAETLRALRADVGTVFAGGAPLGAVLQRCAEAVVRHLDAAFARVWLLDEAGQVLELRASAGLYTHLDGGHARVPVGELKIGRIAAERRPHLTNDVATDPQTGDREWAAREGMVAFAGYPLLVEDRLVGVVALFARHPLPDDALEALAAVADAIAQGVERKRTEAALRRSEGRFRALVEHASDLVSVFDRDGVCTYASPAWERVLGYRPEELLGRHAAEVDHPDDAHLTRRFFADLARRPGAVDRFEVRVLHRDGSIRWLEVVAANRLDDPAVGGIVVTSRDVTERKAAEAALREAEARYRTLVEQVPGVIYVEALAGGANPYISPQVEALLGYRPEEVTGDPQLWMSRVHPDDHRRVAEEVQRTDATGDPYRMEYRMVARDGRVVWVHNEAALVHDEAGRPRFWHGLVMDVTDRKAVEAALWESEARFRSLVQNALDVITILEADGTVRYKSPGIERELGYTADELSGTNVFALIHPDDVARAQRLFAELLGQAGGKAAVEIRCRHKDGSWRWLEVIGTNLIAEPSVGGIVVNSRDVTERKALEGRLAHLAYHDALTDLPNRALFLERLAAALSTAGREADAPVAILLLDLDGFKLVNDSRGHAAGDALLVAVGRRLR
ncbi:MAG: PAS domain S-box protein, partial [Chloroflexota bacterium]|nr:PAS domain S-box protein [Chloroflexota bacterium]